MTFDLTGIDEVTLVEGTSYAFEILSTTTASGSDLSWFRTGSDVYTGGNGFVERSTISGSGRDLGFAYVVVPEPASLALIGLGGLMMIVRRRLA